MTDQAPDGADPAPEQPPPPADETRPPRGDRWAHRRAEPRPFAFLWTIFLLGGAVLTVLRAGAVRGMEIDAARTPARALLVVIGVGLIIVWPLIRLSQQAPERPARAALQDLLVALCPVQAVLWPLTLIGRWNWDITLALSVYYSAWAILAGALVALGTGSRRVSDRSWWMLGAVVIAIGAPTLGLVSARVGAGMDPRYLLPSPVTAPFVVTASPGGRRPIVPPDLWVWSAALAGAGLVGWTGAAVRDAHAAKAPPRAPGPNSA